MMINELTLLMPEFILLAGAMVLLLFGAYFNKENSVKVLFLAIFILLISGISICNMEITTEVGAVEILNGFLIVNGYIIFAKYITITAALLVTLMYFPWARVHEHKMPFEVPVLMLLATAGASFLIAANNLLSLYLALELMSLSLYIMVSINRHDGLSAEAGLKYFVLGALSSGLFLFGASFIYGSVGSIDFTQISNYHHDAISVKEVSATSLAFVLGVLLIIIAFCFKLSAAPFHMWAPDVYQGAPMPVTAFLATVPKIAAILLLLRLLFKLFAILITNLQPVLYIICVASMFIGALGAIMQTNIKRLLAYSSIGHIGFVLMGAVSGQSAGIKGVLLYMLIYLMMTVGIFACLILINSSGQSREKITDLAGLSKQHPYLAVAISVFMFSMAGIPPLAGFFAKFYVLYAAVQAGFIWLAVMGVLASVIAAFYYLYLVKIIYFDSPTNSTALEGCNYLKVMIFITTAFNLLFGVFPAKFMLIAEISASWLL